MTASPTDNQRIRRAAEILAECRRLGTTIDRLPEANRPQTITDAYLVQKDMAALLGVTSIGWKVSLYGPPGCAVAAPIFAIDIHPSPAKATGVTMIETEVALKLSADLPVRLGRPYARAEITKVISTYALGFELVRPRITGPDASYEERLADCLINCGLVIGTEVPFTCEAALPRDAVQLYCDGAPRAYTPNPIDPVAMLQAYANTGGDRFGGLKAGQWVTTGSLTGMEPVLSGEAWHATLDGGLSVSFDSL